MNTVAAALAEGAQRLRLAGIPDATRDARRLMAAALGLAPERLVLAEGELSEAAGTVYERMIDDRSRFRPVAQIVGRRAFYGRDFIVTGAVLDPRQETETLVAHALGGPVPARMLDLGTGSGAILVTVLAERPTTTGIGTDIDLQALAVAAENAARHGVSERAELRRGVWFEGIAEQFDLVISNPPYIPSADIAGLARDVRDWEPRHALTAGATGLEAYAAIAAGLRKALAPDGRALFEIGASQGAAVAALFAAEGYPVRAVHADLDGRDRVVEVGPV